MSACVAGAPCAFDRDVSSEPLASAPKLGAFEPNTDPTPEPKMLPAPFSANPPPNRLVFDVVNRLVFEPKRGVAEAVLPDEPKTLLVAAAWPPPKIEVEPNANPLPKTGLLGSGALAGGVGFSVNVKVLKASVEGCTFGVDWLPVGDWVLLAERFRLLKSEGLISSCSMAPIWEGLEVLVLTDDVSQLPKFDTSELRESGVWKSELELVLGVPNKKLLFCSGSNSSFR